MLTPTTRLRLQEIIDRIGNDSTVSLADRIYLQKFADRDASVASWLRRARRQQLQLTTPLCSTPPLTGLDRLMADLDLGEADPSPPYNPDEGDLGEWFGGAPGWLRRS